MSDTTSLKPCPFCGDIKYLVPTIKDDTRGDYDNAQHYVHCCNCESGGPVGYEREAVGLWNKRPGDDE